MGNDQSHQNDQENNHPPSQSLPLWYHLAQFPEYPAQDDFWGVIPCSGHHNSIHHLPALHHSSGSLSLFASHDRSIPSCNPDLFYLSSPQDRQRKIHSESHPHWKKAYPAGI